MPGSRWVDFFIVVTDMAIETECLKHLCYFEGCTAAELQWIKQYVVKKELKEGEVVVFQGDPCSALHFVVSGAIKVYKTSFNGREQILHIAQKGESIGDIGIFDGGPAPASMAAITPTILYQIKKNDLQSVLRKYPIVVTNALKALAERVRRDARLVEELSFNQVSNRVARLLLNYVEWETGTGIRLTQQDMANMVGSSREMVNKSLRYMEDRSALRTTRKGIEILDRKILEGIAETPPMIEK
jgi:CRP/FNR family cyclic AMP-dependent transcriptional regulator